MRDKKKLLKITDAIFNVGSAIGAAQNLLLGVYIVMNGCVYEAEKAKKIIKRNNFKVMSC